MYVKQPIWYLSQDKGLQTRQLQIPAPSTDAWHVERPQIIVEITNQYYEHSQRYWVCPDFRKDPQGLTKCLSPNSFGVLVHLRPKATQDARQVFARTPRGRLLVLSRIQSLNSERKVRWVRLRVFPTLAWSRELEFSRWFWQPSTFGRQRVRKTHPEKEGLKTEQARNSILIGNRHTKQLFFKHM